MLMYVMLLALTSLEYIVNADNLPSCIEKLIEYSENNDQPTIASHLKSLSYPELERQDKCSMLMYPLYEALREKTLRPDPFDILPEQKEKMIKNSIIPGKLELLEGEEFESINGRKYKFIDNDKLFTTIPDEIPSIVEAINPGGFNATYGDLYSVDSFPGIDFLEVGNLLAENQ